MKEQTALLYAKDSPVRVFPVRSNGRILMLRPENIDWVEAVRNAVCLHVGTDSYILKGSLDRIEIELSTRAFLRIHRSTIVNIDHIRELQPWLRGNYRVILEDGTQLLLSRNYKDKFFEILGQPLG